MQAGAVTVRLTLWCCGCSFDDVVFMSEGIVVSLQVSFSCVQLSLHQCSGLLPPRQISHAPSLWAWIHVAAKCILCLLACGVLHYWHVHTACQESSSGCGRA